MVGLLPSASIFAAAPDASLTEHPTHCSEDEVALYNCTVEGSGKVASVCAIGADAGGHPATHVQYRFGHPGAVEFVFPAAWRSGNAGASFYFDTPRTQDGSTQDYYLWFRHGGDIHQIYYREEFEGGGEAMTDRAAFVSAWRGRDAWYRGDTSKGWQFRCINPEAAAGLKSLGAVGGGLTSTSTKQTIFASEQ